jgi:hypothetical protein
MKNLKKLNKTELTIEDLIKKFFDRDFYSLEYPDVVESGEDPLSHFLSIGWRESRKPNKWFKNSMVPNSLILEYKDIPPFLLFLEECITKGISDFEKIFHQLALNDRGHSNCWNCEIMKSEFDGAFYRSYYPDLSGVEDALIHFCELGWKEGRDPRVDFESQYYLKCNKDVNDIKINPFVHFLTEGKKEQRKPRPLNPIRDILLDHIPDFDTEVTSYTLSQYKFGQKGLLLQNLFGSHNGIILSISHDNYLQSTGGIQLFIRNECSEAIKQGYKYLHLSPIEAKNKLTMEPASTTLISVNLDNQNLGIFSLAELSEVLFNLQANFTAILNTFVVHSCLGWNLESLKKTFKSKFTNNYFYVHDYHFLCKEFRLLRNFVENCGAPSPNSSQCKICSHSTGRDKHLSQFKSLFQTIPFTLVFPSNAALDVYKKSRVNYEASIVLSPHISPKVIKSNKKTIETLVQKEHKSHLRIAFCGEPVPHKGFFHFLEIIRQSTSNPFVEFYHLGRYPSGHKSINFVKTTILNDTSQMSKHIKENKIDFVFMGSYWSETFNYVAYEATEGGAALIGNKNSGNIADFIESNKVGFTFSSINDCLMKLSDKKFLLNSLNESKNKIASIQFSRNLSKIFTS